MTYLNLAVALQNMGRSHDAETVLEKGIAVAPWNGPLIARMAIQYAIDEQSWRAYALIRKYRQAFPEDPVVRRALEQINDPRILNPGPQNSTATDLSKH
jgi:Flp pilus assembly protein TadD